MYQIVSWLVSWLINTGSNQGFKHFKEGHFWHAREQGAYSKVEQPGTIRWVFFNNMDLAKMYYMRSRKIKICTFNLISDTLFMKSQLMLYGLMNPQSPKAALNSENSDKQYRNICRNR